MRNTGSVADNNCLFKTNFIDAQAAGERAKGMTLRDLWYENAIIYGLDIETFADSNGDGIGDFVGLTQRLDYLSGLGVTCLWLMPFFPTSNRDDGYDVSDYCAIDPRLGTMADFSEFVIEAQERGLHVIIDLVANHTSIEHPWFQAARSDPNSPYRDYYVWRTDDPGNTADQTVFPGEQESIWTFDKQAKAWYLHHFYDFQPDLNFANPAVRDEFRKIMGLWLQLGVSGFRIDAAPFLINTLGVDGDSLRLVHDFLRELREFAMIRSGNAILLGEADVPISTIADYFGEGSELQLLFNFPVNRFIFLALSQQSADPVMFGLQQIPAIPASGQWVNFLRHHDELNLAQLMVDQRNEVLEQFAEAPEMQVYGRGTRRRLAPMLQGDQQRIRLAYSLLFSLPGAPMLFYGEENGMGENLDLEGRLSMCAPMAWSARENGGFSTAPSRELVRPVLADGKFGYEQVNVDLQRGDPGSLLNWMAALIRVRRERGTIGRDTWEIVKTGSISVLGLRYVADGESLVILNNLSPEPQKVTLDCKDIDQSTATDLLINDRYQPFNPAKPVMELGGYGFRWMHLQATQ
jgi:maltose alpha-D-glucosyltransferase/alpha-amylase